MLHNTGSMYVGVIGWIIGSCDGRFILDHVNAQENPPRIIVYTGHHSEAVPAQVMAHGGAAFVSKSEQPGVLLDTVEVATLTRRELEVLSDLAAGRTNKQMARDQNVSLNTIKFHVRNLFQKLGVNSRGQAIAMYLRS